MTRVRVIFFEGPEELYFEYLDAIPREGETVQFPSGRGALVKKVVHSMCDVPPHVRLDVVRDGVGGGEEIRHEH